jgi:hypothetical protein
VAEGYCSFCGHVHKPGHSCEQRVSCEWTEQQNELEFLNAAGSYRKRKR